MYVFSNRFFLNTLNVMIFVMRLFDFLSKESTGRLKQTKNFHLQNWIIIRPSQTLPTRRYLFNNVNTLQQLASCQLTCFTWPQTTLTSLEILCFVFKNIINNRVLCIINTNKIIILYNLYCCFSNITEINELTLFVI